MIAAGRHARLWAATLITLVVLLALEATLLYWALNRNSADGAPATAPLALTPVPAMADREAFAQVEARNLFHWDRRFTRTTTSAAAAGASPSAEWQLLGIVGAAGGKVAIFSDAAGELRVRLREGESVSTMRVQRILPEQVIAVIAGEEKVFQLGKAGAEGPTQAPGLEQDERIRRLPKNLLTPEMINRRAP